MVEVRTKNALYNDATGALEVTAKTLGTVIGVSAPGRALAVHAEFTVGGVDYAYWLPVDDVEWATDGPLDPLNLWCANMPISSYTWADDASDFDPASATGLFRRSRSFKLNLSNGIEVTVSADRNSGGLTFKIEP